MRVSSIKSRPSQIHANAENPYPQRRAILPLKINQKPQSESNSSTQKKLFFVDADDRCGTIEGVNCLLHDHHADHREGRIKEEISYSPKTHDGLRRSSRAAWLLPPRLTRNNTLTASPAFTTSSASGSSRSHWKMS